MSSPSDYTRNHKYVDHLVILSNLQRLFKNKEFYEPDVINWCQEVETRDICDVDNMVRFVEVPLKVDNYNSIELPCNIYKIDDLFLSNGVRVPFTTSQNGSKLIVRDELTLVSVYINYIGTPVDEQGTPLIVRGHENACVYKCLTNGFMEEFAMGTVNQNAYMMWEQKATNYIRDARNGLRHKTRGDWNNLNIIQGNLVPKIGRLALYQNTYL